MAANSFIIKGWSVTLVAAILAIAVTTNGQAAIPLAFGPAFAFWLLDAYFLDQERAYRGLYGDVIKRNEADIDYSLDARSYHKGFWGYLGAVKSLTLLLFHGGITTSIGILIYLTQC